MTTGIALNEERIEFAFYGLDISGGDEAQQMRAYYAEPHMVLGRTYEVETAIDVSDDEQLCACVVRLRLDDDDNLEKTVLVSGEAVDAVQYRDEWYAIVAVAST
jgi:hypothetical protein